MSSTTPSVEEVERDLRQFGERLAFLLAAADIPSDVKDAWVTLVPKMTLEQIDRLSGILERYVKGAVATDVRSFREEIEKLKEKQRTSLAAAAQTALDEMDAVEKQIQG
ncbi:MAG: hypothetical protein UU48_C0010G0021 [Candidatus Uhrbacteria bacterium GW2011_GWF2_41_16]|jgi:hypothetical protein|uniref:Uncharacterized protein n=2 Tax=Candidatus Uhriibacteriota TaxID=1752732 RepID=A0A0G0YBL7_9BACT|nr:MAG: hypothetical protein UU35_C0008G0014 [Candidatus Uhrbacteria bacterium GW2011_GWC2_41_11]KKR97697.1 MAG: hypothetical protein UU48_C0010G0021 [Candidatus Uhrbacteria bacterium GW2011_GWF2_41_16]HBO99717.1 hypothetical protein [Candidatus Uhrbacteria bacterium]